MATRTEEILQEMGAVPAGIDVSQRQRNHPLDRLSDALDNIIMQHETAVKERQEKMKKATDYYNTLRNAGYGPKDAFKATDDLYGGIMRSTGLTAPTEESSFKGRKEKAETEKVEYEAALKKKELGRPAVKKPSDMELWKQAEKEVSTELGGLSSVGMGDEERKKYRTVIKERFLELKQEFNGGPPSKREPDNLTEEVYTPEQEKSIQENMAAYGKTREEVIAAMKNKGLL